MSPYELVCWQSYNLAIGVAMLFAFGRQGEAMTLFAYLMVESTS